MSKPRRGREHQPASKHQALADMSLTPRSAETYESDAQIEKKLTERFEILSALTEAAIQGNANACIFSGPAGLGKSFTVEKALDKWDPARLNHIIVKGYVKATGLYKVLYQYREKGQVIVFDDADSVFFDDTALSLLKAVCDTCEKRRVSYLSEGGLVDEESGQRIPRDFDFDGTVIFITNLDFDALIDRSHKIAPHLEAMVSRAHYVDLAMKTKRDYLVRIKQVVRQGLLDNVGLTKTAQNEVMAFVDLHKDNLRELSLRIPLKIAALRKSHPDQWEVFAKGTCCRNQ